MASHLIEECAKSRIKSKEFTIFKNPLFYQNAIPRMKEKTEHFLNNELSIPQWNYGWTEKSLIKKYVTEYINLIK